MGKRSSKLAFPLQASAFLTKKKKTSESYEIAIPCKAERNLFPING